MFVVGYILLFEWTRPSHHDHLQYAKVKEDGLVHFVPLNKVIGRQREGSQNVFCKHIPNPEQ